MKLVSVCVGRTQNLRIRDQNVTTAFLKAPVEGPVRVSANGLEGNDVAVHTDAVYAIAEEHYGHWAEQLGRDVADWPHGFFGENLTIRGLDESQLHVGDILSVGDEVRLSVAGPRIPCFKLCWRLNQPDTFIREFGLSGKSGAYFNVDRPGTIQAGDPVRIVSSANDSFRIGTIAEYALGTEPVDPDVLARVLNLPGLSQTSALLLRNKLYHKLDHQRTLERRWQGWRKFSVAQLHEEVPGVKSFVLKAVDRRPIAPYRAGQFITLKLPIDDGEPLIRVWSISDYQEDPASYRVTVKNEPHSRGGSRFMHEKVTVGSCLDLKPPMGRFVLDRSSFKPVLLIAGGIGITPILAMLKAHLDRVGTIPPVYLVHCCRNRAVQPFRATLDRLQEQHGIKVLHVYSRPDSHDRPGVDYQVRGHLSIAHLAAFMEGCHILHGGKRVDMPWFESDIYLCGPAAFQEDLRARLIEAGSNADRIFSESFDAGRSRAKQELLDQAEVIFSTANKSVTWHAESGKSLLELAEIAGLQPTNACRMGVCQSCSAKLVEGSVHYQHRITSAPANGNILICSAVPASPRVVVAL